MTLGLMLALGVAPVRAAGFGEVQVGSQLGERLYARVPLIGAGTSGITAACVKVVTEPVLQDAPALANARIGIDHGSTPPAIVVLTPAPVLEPAVRFVLELGCGNQLRREFVLLIDPPDLPSVQVATTAPMPSIARAVPDEGSRWGASGVPPAAADAASTPLAQAAPSAPPTQAAAAAPAAAPKPRPKPRPAARPKPVAKAQTPSAPPPPARPPQAARPAGTDRLVLADVDPATARATPDAAAAAAAAEQAAKAAAREEALTRQIEALTKEVARMREDMDKLATRNRELQKEAENSRTGWFAAGGLGIALAGIALGLLGRREKKKSWRDNLSPAFDEPEGPRTAAAPQPAPREDRVAAPKPAAPAVAATGFHLTSHDVSDLDVTKIDVQESVGHTLLNEVASAPPVVAGTTMSPSDAAAASTLTPEERATISGPLQSLDFSLDDIDLSVPTATQPRRTSPVFQPTGPTGADSEAARAKLFEEIEVVHRASRSKS